MKHFCEHRMQQSRDFSLFIFKMLRLPATLWTKNKREWSTQGKERESLGSFTNSAVHQLVAWAGHPVALCLCVFIFQVGIIKWGMLCLALNIIWFRWMTRCIYIVKYLSVSKVNIIGFFLEALLLLFFNYKSHMWK